MAHSKGDWDVKRLTKKKKNPPPRSIIPLMPISNVMHPRFIRSHRTLGPFLDRFMINRLNTLFKNNGRVTEFVKEERRRRGLDEANTTVESMVYGTDRNNSTLLLIIKRDGKEFIHLTIHLSPKELGFTIKSTGIVHIVKNIYNKYVTRKKNYLAKSLYAVYRPQGKSHSLQFRIVERYTTPENPEKPEKSESVSIINQYDDEVKQEMDVLTSVLNKLFDEDDREHYVGDYDAVHHISQNNKKANNVEPNTNNILRNINLHSNAITRKNKGVYFKNNEKHNGGRKPIGVSSRSNRRI